MAHIPKNVHIIWIGGALPVKNQNCVNSFAAKNPDWNVHLWYDPDGLLAKYRHTIANDLMKQHIKTDHSARTQAAHGFAKDLQKKKKNSFDDAIVSYMAHSTALHISRSRGQRKDLVESYKHILREEKDQNLKVLRDYAAAGAITLKSVEEFNYGPESPYTIEMRQRGNFGALSDIVRIDAILKYGGVYFDTDVECKEALGDIDVTQNLGRYSCTHAGMAAQIKAGGIKKTDWLSDDWWSNTITGNPPALVNSIIAAHAGSDMLEAYREHIKENYKEVHKKKVDYTSFYSGVRADVIKRTGPGTLKSAVASKSEDPNHPAAQFNDYEESLDYKLWFRDTLAFPMYKVEDKFFHDWL
jgi:mannosyltransferase OCH1-like enzyme